MRALAGVILVLSWVSVADAECAWVLWAQMGRIDPNMPFAKARESITIVPVRWAAMDSFLTLKACRDAEKEADDREWISGQDRTAGIQFRNRDKPKGALWDVMVYQCLPDTIDPRGPKVGGR